MCTKQVEACATRLATFIHDRANHLVALSFKTSECPDSHHVVAGTSSLKLKELIVQEMERML